MFIMTRSVENQPQQMTYIATQSNLAVLQCEFIQFRVSPMCTLQNSFFNDCIDTSNA